MNFNPKFPTRQTTILGLALLLAMYGAAKVFIAHDAHAIWMLIAAPAIAIATLIIARWWKSAVKRWAQPDKRSQLKL
jgi:Ser/Thr protein kinase RdoA (MazF antagonist)